MTDQERMVVSNVLSMLDLYYFERNGNEKRILLASITQQLAEMIQADTVRRSSALDEETSENGDQQSR